MTTETPQIDFELIKSGISNLEDLAIMKKAAGDAFNEAVKELAGKSNIKPSSLKKLVSVRLNDSKQAALEESEEVINLLEQL